MSLKRYLEVEMVYEKLKCIQPRTEGERKKEQIVNPQGAASRASSPPAPKSS